MMDHLIYAYRGDEARRILSSARDGRFLGVYFIGSTKTSTIPGISVAGATPELTLYTPAVDAEYLFHGRPLSLDQIPVTPEGIPTPALITRAALNSSNIPFIVVDAGSYVEPKIPHVDLPSRVVGERIDLGRALPHEAARNLFEESKILADELARLAELIILGESIPGGTTTALGILIALGYEAWGMVSSSAPENPQTLKQEIVRRGLKRSSGLPGRDPFEAVARLGDPVHISMAGFLAGAVERDARIILAGGTQMAAVLAIAKHAKVSLEGRVLIGTTRWLLSDDSSDLVGLVKMIHPNTPIVAYDLDFSNAPHEGLRYYERGYVKEGVGAGGTCIAAAVKGVAYQRLLHSIYEEYERLINKSTSTRVDGRDLVG